MNYRILNLAKSNFRGKIAESIYLKANIDITRPVQIYGLINNNCNAKCIMCDSWNSKEFSELPASIWINALKSLKSFLGSFHINFSGGEPLIKKDFLEILEFCNKKNIMAGFTTNGLLLNKNRVQKILNLNPVNINISLDSLDQSIHDEIRGVPGMLVKVKENIRYLMEQKNYLGNSTQIILKPIVCKQNLSSIDQVVEYAQEMNLTGVNFQPIFKWSKESEAMFEVDKQHLSMMVEKLIGMKKKGYNILNSEMALRQWLPHFDEIIPERNSPCVVALRNLTIKPNGDVFMCAFLPSKIGNIKDGNIKEMWTSQETKRLRKEQVECKRLCTATCVVKRSWGDYAALFYRFLR